jgi:hypothetical protein
MGWNHPGERVGSPLRVEIPGSTGARQTLFPTIVNLISFLLGLIILMLGFIGEYI